MDFKELNNIKFNHLPNVNKEKAKKEEKKHDLIESNVSEKMPSDPSFWQSTYGVKNQNVSFSGKQIQNVDETYVDEKISGLGSVFYWLNKDTLENLHKENLCSLLPYGKQALDNYQQIVSGTALSFVPDENRDNLFGLILDFLKIMPDFDSEYIPQITDILLKSLRKDSDFEVVKKLIADVLSGNDIDKDEKLFWFINYVNRLYYENHQEDDTTLIDYSLKHANSYFNLADYLNQNQENKALFSLKPEHIDAISNLISSGKLSVDEFRCFLKNESSKYCTSLDKLDFQKLIDKISNDDEMLEVFSKLIGAKMFKNGINASSAGKILEYDAQLLNVLLSKISANIVKDGEFVFTSPSDLLYCIKYLDKDNVEDFIDVYKNEPLIESIYNAQYCVNPKTSVFDRKIADTAKELERNGVKDIYVNQTAIACIDMKTGEISPVAKKLLDFLYPPQSEQGVSGKLKSLKHAIKNKYLTASRLEFMTDDNPSSLIDALKNKEGAFEEKNLDYVFNIIKFFRNIYSYSDIFYQDIVDILNVIKDENGVADKAKFQRFKSLEKLFESYDQVVKVMQSLNMFPQEKRQEIIDISFSLGGDEELFPDNFSAISKYCFDEDGNMIQENVAYVRELFKIKSRFLFSENFFDICRKHPDYKPFVKSIAENLMSSVYISDIENELPKFFDNNGQISDFIQTKMLEYTKSGGNLRGFSAVMDYCSKGNNGEDKFNAALFKNIIDFRQLAVRAKAFTLIASGGACVNLVGENLNVSEMNFKDKVSYLSDLSKIQEYIQKNNISGYDYIDKAISVLEASLKLENIALPIEQNVKIDFLTNILASKSEYTKFETTMIEAIPLLESLKEGLPLTYPRAELLKDLSSVCRNDEDIELLKKKAGIIPIFSESSQKDIIGYNGLIKLSDFDLNNPQEKKIYDYLYKFMYNNEVNTGNRNLDEQLNKIIKACPEFINTIGKKQHATHDYTLDVHSLLVMAYSIADENYNKKLNNLDKMLLKTTAIFHDIMKQEGVVDKGHQNLSSLYTRSIITKIFNSPEIQDRVYGLVNNHHWGEEIATSSDIEKTSQELAFKFRRPNDLEIAKIMAKSDLKAVSSSFYERYKDNISSSALDKIAKNIEYLYSNGNAIFSDYIVAPSALDNCIEEKDGKKYKVINLHKISNTEDMGKYGFRNNLKKDDLRFLVHMVDNNNMYHNLNTVKLLTSPFNGGVLSESLITPQYKRTYSNREYGVLLSQENINVVNEANSNQGSGLKKGFAHILNLVFGVVSEDRNYFRDQLLQNLGLSKEDVSDEEYARFYKNVLSLKNSLQQISPARTYKLGSFSISAEDLINAIKKYQDSLIDKKEETHNEIVGYIPKIQAVIAKEKTINALPDELLKFAYENNYPIILI